jgi:hypothetical protein
MQMYMLQLNVPRLDSTFPLANATKPDMLLGKWYDWNKEKLKPGGALCIDNGCCWNSYH